MVVMILTSISVAMAVFVLHIHSLGERCAHIPPWIHRIITRYLARLVGMTYIVRHRINAESSGGEVSEEEGRPLQMECEEIATRYRLLQVEGHGLYILAKDDESVPMDKGDKEDMNDLQRVQGTCRENGKTLKAMKAIIVKEGSSGEDERKRSDRHVPPVALMWHDIAAVVDRMLFWVSFTTLVISTVSLLVIMPMSKPDPFEARKALQPKDTLPDSFINY